MKGVILDKSSFDRNDIDLSPLDAFDTLKWTNYPSTRNEFAGQRIGGQNIVITNKVVLDREAILAAKDLKLVLIAATGTDNVDLECCRERGITVCNVRHYSTPAVVQHTIALMLNLMTNQPRYFKDVQNNRWQNSDVFCLLDYPIFEASGKTMGVIGYGALGEKVAGVAAALGMSIIVCQRPGGEPQSGRVAFEELLQTSDVISLHCPLTPETHHLFSTYEFKKMKSSAFIINTARGAIIDSQALVNALKSGEIAGAGIDVLDKEPPVPDHPLLEKNIPNLIITPHNAWGTRESRQRLVAVMADNIRAWASGNPVNVVT
jgi:glycerate dehydrogenase